MNNQEKPIVILGGGPAGLSAGRRLTRAGKKVIIVEKDSKVGGISSSQRWGDFIVEYGPHTYHVKRDKIDELVQAHYPRSLPYKKRLTRMLIRGRIFDYPLKFWQLVKRLDPLFSARMLADFAYVTVKKRIFPTPDGDFEAWGVKRFGRTLYNLCFGQYTERVWGIPAKQLSVRLATQKLHQLNLKDVIIKLLGGKGQEQVTYWEDFFYPEEGMGTIFDNMAARITDEGGEIRLNSLPVEIHLAGDRAESLVLEQDGTRTTIPCSSIISTIHLSALASLASSGAEAVAAGKGLRSRSLILVNLVFAMPSYSDAHWVYLIDPYFRFNRFCEQKNLLMDKKPYDRTMLTFELCCDHGDTIWNAPDSRLVEMAMEDCSRIRGISSIRLEDSLVKKAVEAYPVYDLGFEERLAVLFSDLSRLQNLYSTGRQGLFLNTNMHDTIELGMMTAEKVLQGQPSPAWYQGVIPYLARKTGGTNR